MESNSKNKHELNNIENRQTEVIDNRATEVDNNRVTEVIDNRANGVDNNRVTEVADSRATEILDDRATEVESTDLNDKSYNKAANARRTKIDVGDIINGYVIGELISESSGESDIHLCHKENKTYVAKIYTRGREINKDPFEKLIQSQAANLVIPLEIGEINNRFYEIQEYYKDGTLFDDLKNISLEFIKTVVVKDLNEALAAYHKLDLVHNDIKPHNIFFTNNKKNIVLGDFGITQDLDGRSYVTNVGGALTSLYGAPEQGVISSEAVDYYGFGMTLLHLALGDDPFKGVSNHEVRKYKMMNSLAIPEEVDSDLADLIYGLTLREPTERFKYDDVKKWLDNNQVFKNTRKSRRIVESTVEFDNYTFSVNGKRENFTNTYDLGFAMLTNLEEAEKHFLNKIITNKIAEVDQDLAVNLNNIYKKYNIGNSENSLKSYAHRTLKEQLALKEQGNTPSSSKAALYEFIYTLDHNLPLSVDEKVFDSFTEMVLYFEEKAPKDYSFLFDKEILEKMFRNQPQVFLERINTVLTETNFHPKNAYYLFLTLFSEKGFIYSNNMKYVDLSEFADSLFQDFEPREFSIETDLFYDHLIRNFKLAEAEIRKIQKINNLFERNIRLAYLLKGGFPFIIDDFKITNFSLFLQFLRKVYDEKDKQKLSLIHKFIESGAFYELTKLENTLPDEFLNQLRTSKNPTLELYYVEQETKDYNGSKEVINLISKLEKSKDIVNDSNNILNDEDFYIWLKYLGYKL